MNIAGVIMTEQHQMFDLPQNSICLTPAPPLKWAGGKRWLIPMLQQLWKPFKNYTLLEPFVGGMAVSLGLLPKRAILNDINPHLINFYKQVSSGLEISIELSNDREAFYKYRSRFNELIENNDFNSSEAAQIFYYLNRTCYNGLCRFNSKGHFNVPFGRYKVINYLNSFAEYKQHLEHWQFFCLDYSEVLTNFNDSKCFVYADPPYDVEFTKYYKDGFSWEQQIHLAELLNAHKGPVVVSNQATDRIIELYSSLGFSISIVNGPRRISCTGNREPAREILAYKGLDYE